MRRRPCANEAVPPRARFVSGLARWLATWAAVLAALAVAASPARAIPPLVAGDVPTADEGLLELFVGYVLKDGGSSRTHELPFWEVVYGLTKRQELTIEAPILLLTGDGRSILGPGDIVIGTKYRLLGKPAADSGASVSLEIKLPNADRGRGLGSGAANVDLRTRWGWEIGREVVYFNLGRTWVGGPNGARRRNTWFYAGVWDHPAGPKLRILFEVYAKTPDEPGGQERLAFTVGLKRKLPGRQQLHLSVGRSLRARAAGGPSWRVYTGWRQDF